MQHQHLFNIRHLLYKLRGGFLIRPIVIALIFGFLGAFLSTWEEGHPGLGKLVPTFLFPSHDDPQIAQIILSSIATSMMTVVAIVFSILLMTLTLASMQFSPRIIVSFVNDRVTQQTLGIFLGTFLYCIAALPAARKVPLPFSPVLTVMGAMVLALACVAWLIFFISHISQSISVNNIVDRIARETETMIDSLMPENNYQDTEQSDLFDQPSPYDSPVLSKVSGYIHTIDPRHLVAIAKSNRITVRVLRRFGHFVPHGVPLLTVSKAQRNSPELSEDLRRAFQFGPTRTLEQDIQFGILQIVDIALKAISPAVNDPSTAITCVDQLSSILIKYSSGSAVQSRYYDPPGVLRVVIPNLGLERLSESAFEQIRTYANSDVAVSLRLMRAFADIAVTLPNTKDRLVLVNHGRRVLAGFTASPGEDVLAEMKNRLSSLEKMAESAS